MKAGTHLRRSLRRALVATAAGVALGAVFLAYLNPHLARDVAIRLWACF